jgi:hypothetical protein
LAAIEEVKDDPTSNLLEKIAKRAKEFLKEIDSNTLFLKQEILLLEEEKDRTKMFHETTGLRHSKISESMQQVFEFYD